MPPDPRATDGRSTRLSLANLVARPMTRRALPVSVALLSYLCLVPLSALAAPAEGECPAVSAAGEAAGDSDAVPLVIEPGMKIGMDQLLAIRGLLPQELWQYREAFFYQGMQMVIGPCHRRFLIPGFYRRASEAHRDEVSLDEEGNLLGYRAGLPFPEIDPEDPQAAVKWAWNFQKRYRGAGHEGRFRLTVLPAQVGGVQRYTGKFFILQTGGRSDLAETDYREPGSGDKLWASGGRFDTPFSARELAWRQFRVAGSERSWEEPDDIFVYLPSLRKMRRGATNWVDGLFVPSYGFANEPGSGAINFGTNAGIHPGAGRNLAASQDSRTGLLGLSIRPNAYTWRLHGEKTVLAPLNAVTPGYPTDTNRNYGYSGLSVASDRWDVREAVVIEGRLRKENDNLRTLLLYIDRQTLQPLYWISRTGRRRILDVGIFVHRFSDDQGRRAEWPGGLPSSIFEPVASAFYNALGGGGGWLRESYELESLPFDPDAVKRMTSSSGLQQGH